MRKSKKVLMHCHTEDGRRDEWPSELMQEQALTSFA